MFQAPHLQCLWCNRLQADPENKVARHGSAFEATRQMGTEGEDTECNRLPLEQRHCHWAVHDGDGMTLTVGHIKMVGRLRGHDHRPKWNKIPLPSPESTTALKFLCQPGDLCSLCLSVVLWPSFQWHSFLAHQQHTKKHGSGKAICISFTIPTPKQLQVPKDVLIIICCAFVRGCSVSQWPRMMVFMSNHSFHSPLSSAPSLPYPETRPSGKGHMQRRDRFCNIVLIITCCAFLGDALAPNVLITRMMVFIVIQDNRTRHIKCNTLKMTGAAAQGDRVAEYP